MELQHPNSDLEMPHTVASFIALLIYCGLTQTFNGLKMLRVIDSYRQIAKNLLTRSGEGLKPGS